MNFFLPKKRSLLLQTVSEGQESRSSLKVPGLSGDCSWNVCWGCSLPKGWLGHSLPWLLAEHLTSSHCWQMASVPRHMRLSTRLPGCPHDMAAGSPLSEPLEKETERQRAKQKLQCLLQPNLRSDTPSLPPFSICSNCVPKSNPHSRESD